MDIQDKKYLLGLKLIPDIDRRINKILEVFGSPERAWNASSKELRALLRISIELSEKISSERKKIDLDFEFEKIISFGVEILSVFDSCYPRLLKEISSPPVLFIKGDLIKSYSCAVAIVGSRNASVYGKAVAFELAQQLSDLGVIVVSGVARGIDSAAHRGALAASGETIGVLGCGLDIVYPPENRKLYSEILEKGCLISEQPLGTRPFTQNFPARNRIISGLSEGVIVVEASERSGALITADFALEQGREVMVVPGNVKSSLTKGCHKLIKQGAYLIETIDDVIEVLQLDLKFPKESKLSKDKLEVDISREEQEILNCLGWEPKHIDQILQAVCFDISKVSTLLTILELKGLVKQDFGHNYLRIQ
jgi:DNA processing protein